MEKTWRKEQPEETARDKDESHMKRTRKMMENGERVEDFVRRRVRPTDTRGERGVEERGDGADQAQAASFQRPKVFAMCPKHSSRRRSKQSRPSSPGAKPADLAAAFA